MRHGLNIDPNRSQCREVWELVAGTTSPLAGPPRNKHDLFKSTYTRDSQDSASASYGNIRNGVRYTETALEPGNT